MNEVAFVMNRTKPEVGEIRITWTRSSGMTLHYSSGISEVWACAPGSVILEQFDSDLAIRCNGVRLWAMDDESKLVIHGWFEKMNEIEDQGATKGPVGAVGNEDVQRFAQLLASGAINLREFLVLVNVSDSSGSELHPISEDWDDEERGFQDELRKIIEDAWPSVLQQAVSVTGETSLMSTLGPRIEQSHIWRLLSQDQGDYFHLTTTAAGLAQAYRDFAPHLRVIPKLRVPQQYINPLKTMLKADEESRRFDRELTKFLNRLEDELRSRKFSNDSKIVLDAVTQSFRARQARLKAFAERAGWRDLPFI
jgi:hypothetical protein